MKHRTVRKCEENRSEDYIPVLVNYKKKCRCKMIQHRLYMYIHLHKSTYQIGKPSYSMTGNF